MKHTSPSAKAKILITASRPFDLGQLTVAAAVAIALGIVLLIVTLAASTFAVAQLATGSLSGGAQLVTAAGTTDGHAVRFGTATPSPSTKASTAPTPSSKPAPTASPAPTAAPARASEAVMGFDEAGLSEGSGGNNYRVSQWTAIKNAGYKLFVTDPIEWASECSNGNCDRPVNTCTLDAAEVAQMQDAYDAGLDYAIYTRNVNCLSAAISGLSSTLQAHLSFAVFDIETDPSVKLTQTMVNKVIALGQTPVVYSYDSAWASIMSNTTAFDQYPLWDSEFPSPAPSFPATLPAGFPTIVAMPNPYGGWSGADPKMEQQQYNVETPGDDNANDEVDADAVNAAWLNGLPHQN